MRVHDVISERLRPDQDFLQTLSDGVDEALEEYKEYLDLNNDRDNITVLEDLLNASIDEDLRITFITNYEKTNSDWWMNAEAVTGEDEDGERVTDIDVYLHARNLKGAYGPKTFKKMLMRLISHELVHKDQHSRIPDIGKMASGYQKAANAKSHREWENKYLRDPHELMAYGETLAQEIADTENPQATLRNPEAYMDQLPTYARFRNMWPRNSKYIKALLKYTSQYL